MVSIAVIVSINSISSIKVEKLGQFLGKVLGIIGEKNDFLTHFSQLRHNWGF